MDQQITIRLPRLVKAELTAEAWELGLKLPDYIAGLLSRRHKWARGGYDLMVPREKKG